MSKILSSTARRSIALLVNNILKKVNLKVVNAAWGPRGFRDALQRVKKQGVIPGQIVDVGAGTGGWTRECREVFPEASYFLVDPLEENKKTLDKLKKDNPNIKVWDGALGANAGRSILNVHDYNSSIYRSEYCKSDNFSSREVEVRTLDSFLEDGTIAPPDMIKADVQGFELEILKGAEWSLKNAELLLLEVSYRMIFEGSPLVHDVISYAASKGFRVYDICTYIQRPFDGELAQSDILFAKEASSLFDYEGWHKLKDKDD